ncbi:hypothetical protein Ahy_B07g087788 [Arachis hypogaea]|uniref:Protein FAR1-RELATED SEQUENCE n=1 Tax=Arachis hypogaea TaxID=3818 RepID=A0A444YCY4_ARAHY|nr:hypothetical protein Ahy_B07g087788 [Arachis hypogaea]
MVSKLGLENNQWVCDLYARKKMMTSRCEGLHSMLGKFVHSRHNLRDFVKQFFCCISQMRSRKCQTDLVSVVDNLVLQSRLHALERSGDVDKGVHLEGLIMHTHTNMIESLGILLCDHVVTILVHLDFTEIPNHLFLARWSKNARSRVRVLMDKGLFCWDSMAIVEIGC